MEKECAELGRKDDIEIFYTSKELLGVNTNSLSQNVLSYLVVILKGLIK